MTELFSDLINGIPTPSHSRLIARLKKMGAVVEQDIVTKPVPQEDYLDLLENTVIGPNKIVRQIRQYPMADQFKDSFHVSYASGFAPRLIPGQSSQSGGWGADTDPLLADIKSVVEAVERYALAEYDESALVQKKWAEMESKSPTATQMGSDEQLLETAHPLLWQKLEGLTVPGSIYAPLDFLHHPVDYSALGRLPVAPLNISGVAAHQSLDAAIINGLLELCEHEALMVAWYGKRVTPNIRVKSLDEDSQEHIAKLEQMGWKIILKDISLDLVPVVIVVGLGPVGKRAVTIGSCAAFSSRYAAKKALTEVVRTILTEEASPPVVPVLTREEVNDVATHGLYYSRHENLAEAEILWSGNEWVDATDLLTDGSGRDLEDAKREWEASGDPIGKEKEYVTDMLRTKGIAAYYAETTPKEVQKAGIPLFVVGTLAPEMARMTVGYGRKPAQTKRFMALLSKFESESPQTPGGLHPFS